MSEWNAQQLTEKLVANARILSSTEHLSPYDKVMNNFRDMCNRKIPGITEYTFSFIWHIEYNSNKYIQEFINIANEQGVNKAIQFSTTIINTLISLLHLGFKSGLCKKWSSNSRCNNRNLCLWRHESNLGYRKLYFIDGLNIIEGSKNFYNKIGFERLYLTIIEIIMLGHSTNIKIYFPEKILNDFSHFTISQDPKDFYFNITISLLKSHPDFLVGTRGRDGDDLGVLSCLPMNSNECFIVSKDHYRDHMREFSHLRDVSVIIPNFSLDYTSISLGLRKLGYIWDSKSPQSAPSKYFEPHSLQYRSPGHRYRRSPSPGLRYLHSRSPGHRSRRSRSPDYRSRRHEEYRHRRSRSPDCRTRRHEEYRSRRSRSPECRSRRHEEYSSLRSRSPDDHVNSKKILIKSFPKRECTPEYYDSFQSSIPPLYKYKSNLRIIT